jgi:hypothetical protein
VAAERALELFSGANCVAAEGDDTGSFDGVSEVDKTEEEEEKEEEEEEEVACVGGAPVTCAEAAATSDSMRSESG